MLSNKFFHTNVLYFVKIQTIIKSHSLMPGASNLAILIFSTCFFHFWDVIAHNLMKSRSHYGLATKDLFYYTQIVSLHSENSMKRNS